MIRPRSEPVYFALINIVLPELLSILLRGVSANTFAPSLIWISSAAILAANLWRFRVSVRWRAVYAVAATVGVMGFFFFGILSPARTIFSLPLVISSLLGG